MNTSGLIRNLVPKRIGLAGLLLAGLFVFYACDRKGAASDQAYIEVADDFSVVAVKGINGLDEEHLKNRFQVFVLKDSGNIREGQSPIVGTYSELNNGISFKPVFSFTKGLRYRARFNTLSGWLEQDFFIGKASEQALVNVAQIYPTTNSIPRNVLKFYIQFSDSMARGFAYDNIHFLTDSGDTIQDAFLPLEQELWTPDMKRFTLLMDPGRIKRGLGSLKDLGYAFQYSKSYRLIVSGQWKDAHNNPMKESFEKRFTITDDLRALAGNFNVVSRPEAGTMESVDIRSERPHDYALMQSAIKLTDKSGNGISGKVELLENETIWRFTPNQAWKAQEYQIRLADILEDLAGNNRLNLFDVDNTTEATTPGASTRGYKSISFWPK